MFDDSKKGCVTTSHLSTAERRCSPDHQTQAWALTPQFQTKVARTWLNTLLLRKHQAGKTQSRQASQGAEEIQNLRARTQ